MSGATCALRGSERPCFSLWLLAPLDTLNGLRLDPLPHLCTLSVTTRPMTTQEPDYNGPDRDHLAQLQKGASAWNDWRKQTGVRPVIRNCNVERDLHDAGDLGVYSYPPTFDGYDLSGADLHMLTARNSEFTDCCFDGSALNAADLCYSMFVRCTFRRVSMRLTRLGSASFIDCDFVDSDLAYCSAEQTDFTGSRIIRTSLQNMSLVGTDFSNCDIEECFVYGTSAWDLKLDNCRQRDILISPGDTVITVDNLEVAQFIHLLIKNARIRDVIDTITSRVVLILGRFSPSRKAVLDQIRSLLAERGYVPVLFDFKGPRTRDLTETVSTLAHLSRFVVADLTDPKSVPHELASIIPQLPSTPVQPLVASGHDPYAMFEHLARYPWVMSVLEYTTESLSEVVSRGCSSCEDRIAQGA